MHVLKDLASIALLAPLLGSVIAGLFGKHLGRLRSAWVTIIGVAVSFVCSLMILIHLLNGAPHYNGNIYTWAASGHFIFHAGFLIDHMSALMMLFVTFVSLLVHIYSIGYMKDDPGFQRFFAYMSAFTFAMLALVTANNFLQLFFGWEGVGLVSYLLIGFWFYKPTAANGSFKAFIANRVGDFGFLLGIAAVIAYMGNLDFHHFFQAIPSLSTKTISIIPGTHWSLLTVIALFFFVGAMGKSAQIPLHIWLPESMEGPTPISALIHAATMVTAGIYMVARLSPLYEQSAVALSVVLVIGATGGLFLGLLAIVENDIKRVIAYSTMSQLGYMMAANGASAFSAGMFHLFTHACFKALLFLGAGSVILAMHHEQDLFKMGGLRKYLPITYATFLIGSLALCAVPPFAGFYSKEAIIAAVQHARVPGAGYAYLCLLLGSFVTSFYTFRALFLAFHGQERFDDQIRAHIHEQGKSVYWPLILLAIPSVLLGMIMIVPMLYSHPTLLGRAIYVSPRFAVMPILAGEFHGVFMSIFHAFATAPFWFAVAGIFSAWICYIKMPFIPSIFTNRLKLATRILKNKYGFDQLNQFLFVRIGEKVCHILFSYADVKVIDDLMVNGSGRGITRISKIVRYLQSGYLYHYVFVMMIGLLGFMVWLIFGRG